MIDLIQGFNVTSPLPIDGRILLSRNEMANIDDNIMPDKYFCICEEDGLLYLYDKNNEAGTTGKFIKAVPKKLSELENDGNGTSPVDPFDTISSVDSKIDTLHSTISDDFVDNDELVTALLPYSLIADTGCKITCDQNTTDHEYTFHLKNSSDQDLGAPFTINLPVESLVMSVSYDSPSKSIIITLENGSTTSVPIGSLINGLVNETDFNDHTGNTVVHTNASEKAAWNAKYDKPLDGIPESDLKASVQASLSKADTAIQQSDLDDDHYVTKEDIPSLIEAGENVWIDEVAGKQVISAKDTTYLAGRGIRISSGSDGGEDSHSSVLYISTMSSNPTWVDIDSTSEITPMSNEDLAALFDAKQDKISDGTTIDADSVIDTNSVHKFVTTSDKATWDGKQNAITTSDKLSSDLVDDSSAANKFVTVSEKNTWTAKQDAVTLSNKLSSDLIDDESSSTNKFVTPSEKNTWTAKQDAITSSNKLSYSLLSDTPTIGDAVLTVGVTLDTPEAVSSNNTFTANSTSDRSITIKVPSKTSHLVNDTSLQNATQVATSISSHNSSSTAHSDIRNLISTSSGNISAIEAKIPSQASSSNQLADKEYVNSSISTSTATFKGTVTATADTDSAAQQALSSITGMDDNDYAFVSCVDSVGNTKYKRYKYTGSSWAYEYTLNNSSFTSSQWAAINSGITQAIVESVPSTASSSNELVTSADLSDGLNTKQATLIGSGTGQNIKTVNNVDLVGSGNVSVGTVTSISVAVTSPITTTNSSAITSSGTISLGHANSGVTAGSYGPSANATVSSGGTMTVPYVTVNATGHVTNASDKTITLFGVNTAKGLTSGTSIGVRSFTFTIAANGWTAASGSAGQVGYYKAVTVNNNITADSTPILDVNMSSVSSATAIDNLNEAWSKIYRAVTSANTITFYSTEALTLAIPVQATL